MNHFVFVYGRDVQFPAIYVLHKSLRMKEKVDEPLEFHYIIHCTVVVPSYLLLPLLADEYNILTYI